MFEHLVSCCSLPLYLLSLVPIKKSCLFAVRRICGYCSPVSHIFVLPICVHVKNFLYYRFHLNVSSFFLTDFIILESGTNLPLMVTGYWYSLNRRVRPKQFWDQWDKVYKKHLLGGIGTQWIQYHLQYINL